MYDAIFNFAQWLIPIGILFRIIQWTVSNMFELHNDDYEIMHTVLTPVGKKFWIIPAIFFPITVYYIRHGKAALSYDEEEALGSQDLADLEFAGFVVILWPLVALAILWNHFVVLVAPPKINKI